MKIWTVSAYFFWEGSDDSIDAGGIPDEKVYLLPENVRKQRGEAFVSEDELDESAAYASKEEAEREHAWIKDMECRWMNGEDDAYADEIVNEMPDNYPLFFCTGSVEEVDV